MTIQPASTSDSRRAVFLDVDGTLVRDGHYIPPSAIDAIRAARANGHVVFLSTGRALPELRGAILDIGFDGVISNAGGFATVADELIYSKVIPPEALTRIHALIADRGVYWYLQSYDRQFSGPGLREAMRELFLLDDAQRDDNPVASQIPVEAIESFISAFTDYDNATPLDLSRVANVVMMSDDAATMERLLNDLSDEFAVVPGTIPVPFGASGEVTSRGINKGTAILALLERLGIAAEQAIGIGDNWNDVEMFEVCGTSIAMGNAHPDVQALTDQVTETLDDDGIHHAFARNGLL